MLRKWNEALRVIEVLIDSLIDRAFEIICICPPDYRQKNEKLQTGNYMYFERWSKG